jgi:hypothetical protein
VDPFNRAQIFTIIGVFVLIIGAVFFKLEQVGGTDLMALLSSIIVCGFVVDLSPLSTTGALFIANAPATADKTKLFRNMLIWGLSMSVVGAVVCWLAFTVLGLP